MQAAQEISRTPTEKQRATTGEWLASVFFGLLALASLLFGSVGFLYQGYVEDAGMSPTQSWPAGAIGYAGAVLFTLITVALARPGVRAFNLVEIGCFMTAGLTALAYWILSA